MKERCQSCGMDNKDCADLWMLNRTSCCRECEHG